MTLTIAPVDGEILKRDTAGRVRTPRERREALLMEFDRSGMSGQKFAAWAGMKYTTFANWLQRRRKQPQYSSGAKGIEAVQWVQAVVENRPRRKSAAKPAAVGLIVHGPGGVRIEIQEEKQVDWAAKLLLLRHLGVSGPC